MGGKTMGAIMIMMALPTWAHHSFGMFDLQKELTLAGTVKEFQFSNPHCFIQLLVPAANDKVVEWSIEMGAPAHLIRQRWNPGTLRQGDKIRVVINPLREGGKGGNYVSATRTDGTVVGGGP